MIGRNFSLKLLSVIAVVLLASIGAARAEGGDVVAPAQELGEQSTEQQLCLDSGGEWNDDTCMCSAEKNLVFDENEKQCACKDGYVVAEGQSLKEGGKCVEAKSAAQTACEGEDSLGTWTNGECVCRSGYFFDSTTGKCYKGAANDLQTACTGSGGTWDSGCTCGKEHSSFLNGYCVCDYGYVISGGTKLGDENAQCVRDTGMKIATTAYNNARFSGVQTDLNNAVTKIKSVVVQALANAANVATISLTKQTRPDDLHACADGKTCLLVTTPAGVNNWYEIIDCGLDSFLGNVGIDVAFGSGEYYGGYRTASTSYRACATSGAECGDDEYMRSFTNGAVYGVADVVSIAETTPGTIVELPNNVQAGSVCVCKITGYRLRTNNAYGTRKAVNTDKWYVRGTASTVRSCLHACANDGDDQSGNGIDMPYYANVTNSCAASPVSARSVPVCTSGMGAACTGSGGSWDEMTCSCSCSGKANSTLNTSTGQCVCDNGYTEQSGVCVANTGGQSCMSQSGMSTNQANCVNSAGTWNSDTCQCSCASRPNSTLSSGGRCVCDSGYHASGNTCVVDSNGCDITEWFLEPGTFRNAGEAWYVAEFDEVWGGKSCDGREADINAPSPNPNVNSCHDGEWLHIHDNVGVYGETKVVAITNDTPGTIVSLPNNVQETASGGVCVCRATAYVPVTEHDSQYGYVTHFGTRVNLPTPLANKWLVVGRVTPGEYDQDATNNCISRCAFDPMQWDNNNAQSYWSTYYETVGNSCSNTTVTEATPCRSVDTNANQYVSFVNTAIDRKWISGVESVCAKNSNAEYCKAGKDDLSAWAVSFVARDPNQYFKGVKGEKDSRFNEHYNYNNGTGIIFGVARCVEGKGALSSVGSGGKVVMLNEVPENDTTNGDVCIQSIAGYQFGQKQEIVNLNSKYWYAKKYEKGTCAEACQTISTQNIMSEVGNLVEPVSGMCLEE